jgi:hypothetical protein
MTDPYLKRVPVQMQDGTWEDGFIDLRSVIAILPIKGTDKPTCRVHLAGTGIYYEVKMSPTEMQAAINHLD